MSWLWPTQSKNKLDFGKVPSSDWKCVGNFNTEKKKKGLNINAKLNDVENNTLAREVHFGV